MFPTKKKREIFRLASLASFYNIIRISVLFVHVAYMSIIINKAMHQNMIKRIGDLVGAK